MVFSQLSFLYFFFPLALVLYYLIPARPWRNGVLLAFSVLFYSWGEPRYVLIMVAASFCAWIYGLLLVRAEGRPGVRRGLLAVCTVLLLGNLMVFKYLGFFTENLNALLGLHLTIGELTLPIGISFYTFQILSYVIDLYRGQVEVQQNFFYFTLYVSFFPQLIAGPIVRYQTVEHEIRNRRENWDDAVYGIRRFILGLAKKVLLANNAAKIAELVYNSGAQGLGTSAYWLAAAAYTLQIYFDFSGYSDMAIGLGRMFGFHFLENFNYPYLSRSVTEFWRRWHISLSTWFRDYVYIPLGGNRVGKARWVCNILIVWALTGFWHGAEWNFILWGLYYAALLLLEKFLVGRLLEHLPSVIRWAWAMFFTLIGWVIFDLTDFAQLGLALRTMFVYTPTDWFQVLQADTGVFAASLWLVPAVVFSFPVFRRVHAPDRTALGALVVNLGYLALLALCILYIVSSSFNPFIYFRF